MIGGRVPSRVSLAIGRTNRTGDVGLDSLPSFIRALFLLRSVELKILMLVMSFSCLLKPSAFPGLR